MPLYIQAVGFLCGLVHLVFVIIPCYASSQLVDYFVYKQDIHLRASLACTLAYSVYAIRA